MATLTLSLDYDDIGITVDGDPVTIDGEPVTIANTHELTLELSSATVTLELSEDG